MSTSAAGVAWPAGELIEEGMCSARCLLALGDGPCECPCEGRWHGALADTDAGEGISPEELATRREEARTAASWPRGRPRIPGESWELDYPGVPRDAVQARRGPGGALCWVAVGRNLGNAAPELVLAALASVPEGSSARVVCREANRVKAGRPDLDDRKYLSLGTCRNLLRDLAPVAYAMETS